jgi:nitronate monooxygenase
MSPSTRFTNETGVAVPLICGAMFPCSNPELVAAVSEAGGMGIIQPLSLTYVHKHPFKDGMKLIRSITKKPVGLNVLTEKSLSVVYRKRMEEYVDLALEDGVRFFVTALGNPRWVVERVEKHGGRVYHDVVARKWAEKARDGGVHGLIGVNSRAGGHAGPTSPEKLLEELEPLGLPVVCAGGVGDAATFARMLALGYDAVQMGTRFIATTECTAHADYKQAILDAKEDDIVLTMRVTGVPLAVIKTPLVEKIGTKAGPLARFLLQGRKTKHWVRAWYSLISAYRLKGATLKSSQDLWQAGRSVAGIHSVQPAAEVVRACAEAAA